MPLRCLMQGLTHSRYSSMISVTQIFKMNRGSHTEETVAS